jgi:hypothetical protein
MATAEYESLSRLQGPGSGQRVGMVNSSGNAALSKSLILKGMQCPKALYLAKNPPEFELPPQPDPLCALLDEV